MDVVLIIPNILYGDIRHPTIYAAKRSCLRYVKATPRQDLRVINSLFQFLIMRMVSFLASLARKNTIREACALFASFFILESKDGSPQVGHEVTIPLLLSF
jgi:hypothetical protein